MKMRVSAIVGAVSRSAGLADVLADLFVSRRTKLGLVLNNDGDHRPCRFRRHRRSRLDTIDRSVEGQNGAPTGTSHPSRGEFAGASGSPERPCSRSDQIGAVRQRVVYSALTVTCMLSPCAGDAIIGPRVIRLHRRIRSRRITDDGDSDGSCSRSDSKARNILRRTETIIWSTLADSPMDSSNCTPLSLEIYIPRQESRRPVARPQMLCHVVIEQSSLQGSTQSSLRGTLRATNGWDPERKSSYGYRRPIALTFMHRSDSARIRAIGRPSRY